MSDASEVLEERIRAAAKDHVAEKFGRWTPQNACTRVAYKEGFEAAYRLCWEHFNMSRDAETSELVDRLKGQKPKLAETGE